MGRTGRGGEGPRHAAERGVCGHRAGIARHSARRQGGGAHGEGECTAGEAPKMTAVTGREDPGKLRIGLLLDSFEVPAWVYEMLVTLRQSTYADIALIVVNDSPKPKRRSLVSRVLRAWDSLFFAAYWKLDAKLFAVTPDAFEPRNATALLHDVPVMRVRPECTKYSDRLAGAGIQRDA